MNCEKDETKVRKPYDPPRLVTISLRPEEAVLGHCKVAGGSGPASGCGLVCFNVGS